MRHHRDGCNHAPATRVVVAMRAIGAVFLLFGACAVASGEPRPAGEAGPVIVELFTSQGCSSCPPADAVLAKLAAAGSVDGRRVVPLAFHVDYWNDLGWADPFSRPAWTQRQYAYAQALGAARVYTPQAIVGGTHDVLGSNAIGIATAITDGAAPAKLAATATWSADRLDVSATAPADADVFVAVFEDGLHTKVTRGENSGEDLGGEHVVRRFEKVASAGHAGTLAVKLDPAWQRVGAVAFAQRADFKILSSASLR
jgi:hypothetical protein